jgi:pyridoxal phosphate enzyme (YggS family)
MPHRICENITELKGAIGNVKLVVVSKYRSLEELQQVYACGHRMFGENRVQEMVEKYEQMPKDIEWHLIGHLQRNKVKYIAPFVSLIHSVDSLKLLKSINKESLKNNRIIPFLFQIHIADEETKFGLSREELEAILVSEDYRGLSNVQCQGLMGMATNTSKKEQVKKEFKGLAALFNKHKAEQNWEVLSMGMSGDYPLAVEAGCTHIRVGSKVFE